MTATYALPRDAINAALFQLACHRCDAELPEGRQSSASDDGDWSVWCQAVIVDDGRARLREAALCGGCSRSLRDWLAGGTRG